MLDEPPRLRLEGAARFRGPRRQPGIAGRGARGHRPRPVRDPVPSRGRPHPLRAADPRRFLREIAGCDATWSPASVIDEQVERIRAQVGEAGVICGLSGGVDLCDGRRARAPGGRRPAHVRAGRPRPDAQERGRSGGTAMEELGVNLILVDAEQRFLDRSRVSRSRDQAQDHRRGVHPRLRGRGDKARRGRLLVQGTLYSDVIESVATGRAADTIKSHHNVGGLPEDLGSDLVEPLRMLFKDEVRAVAAELGLSEKVVWRHPVSGPGLAIRIVGGEVNRERLTSSATPTRSSRRRSRRRASTASSGNPSASCPWCARSGSRATGRTYAYPIVIRAVTSQDAMDRRLGPAALRPARAGLEPDQQRGRAGSPSGAGHQLQATGHHRVGVNYSPTSSAPARINCRGYAADFFVRSRVRACAPNAGALDLVPPPQLRLHLASGAGRDLVLGDRVGSSVEEVEESERDDRADREADSTVAVRVQWLDQVEDHEAGAQDHPADAARRACPCASAAWLSAAAER